MFRQEDSSIPSASRNYRRLRRGFVTAFILGLWRADDPMRNAIVDVPERDSDGECENDMYKTVLTQQISNTIKQHTPMGTKRPVKLFIKCLRCCSVVLSFLPLLSMELMWTFVFMSSGESASSLFLASKQPNSSRDEQMILA